MTQLIDVRVESGADEAQDIRVFSLIPVAVGDLPAFHPGSHVDVHILPGLIRQYSLCGDIGDLRRYVIAVKKEPASRGGSRAMHESVEAGQRLQISHPRNNFRLHEDAPRSILLAAGIGVTPIMSMADRLSHLGKPFAFHYFTRGPAFTAFRRRLTGSGYASQVHFHYAMEPDQVRSRLHELLSTHDDGARLYLCGPKPFMDMVEAAAAPAWPSDMVHLEHFSADPDALIGKRGSFDIRLARSGAVFHVPEDKTILDILSGAGVKIEFSCEQGVCGTCLTRVLEGEPDHRDMYLSEGEKSANDRICVCVSRSRSPMLVLDI